MPKSPLRTGPPEEVAEGAVKEGLHLPEVLVEDPPTSKYLNELFKRLLIKQDFSAEYEGFQSPQFLPKSEGLTIWQLKP